MTDYTPTTEQVRNAYVRGMRDTFIASASEHYEEFDRWVQAHDAEVRASVQPPTREQIAEAIAKSQDGHYWVDEIAEWEAREEWEHEAYTDDRPGSAYEDRDSYLKDADAVLALFPQPTPSLRLDVAEQTAITRRIDEEFMQEGGTTRHWVQALNRAGYVIDPITQPARTAEPCTCPPPATHLGEGPGQDCPKHGDRFHVAEPVSIDDMAPGTTFRIESPLVSPVDLWAVFLNDVDREKHALSTTGYDWMLDRIDPSTIRAVTPPPATPEEGDRG